MTNEPHSEARERMLHVAERLFGERGYTAVTLRDIAQALQIKQASLYHHVPGGKEELFIEVTERTLHRHRAGLTQAITQAAPDIRSQLHAAADWLLAQPPVDLVRMTYSDMPQIDPAHVERLSQLAYAAMIAPLEVALGDARQRGEIDHQNMGLVAGGLMGMVESLHAAPQFPGAQSRQSMAHDLIDVLLDGLHTR